MKTNGNGFSDYTTGVSSAKEAPARQTLCRRQSWSKARGKAPLRLDVSRRCIQLHHQFLQRHRIHQSTRSLQRRKQFLPLIGLKPQPQLGRRARRLPCPSRLHLNLRLPPSTRATTRHRSRGPRPITAGSTITTFARRTLTSCARRPERQPDGRLPTHPRFYCRKLVQDKSINLRVRWANPSVSATKSI